MSKGNGYGKHTLLETSMFLSPAFLSLGHRDKRDHEGLTVSSCSTQVLIMLLGKRRFGKVDKKGSKARPCLNCNALTLTYKELATRGISQQRATRAIDELLAKGFIKIVHQGGAFDKDKTIYGLTDDYLRWRPGMAPIRERERDIRRGFQRPEKQKQHTLTVVTHTHVDGAQV